MHELTCPILETKLAAYAMQCAVFDVVGIWDTKINMSRREVALAIHMENLWREFAHDQREEILTQYTVHCLDNPHGKGVYTKRNILKRAMK